MAKDRIPEPDHWALKGDGNVKGSYYRRIDDIDRAFTTVEKNLPAVLTFLSHYFGCEKLAQGIVGVANNFKPEDVYGPGKSPDVAEIQKALKLLGIPSAGVELEELFGEADTSVKKVRNRIVHDFGPTNVMRALKPSILPRMQAFLKLKGPLLAALDARK